MGNFCVISCMKQMRSKSKKNTNKTNEYIYSLEYDNIIVLPIKVVRDLVKMWDIIIKGIEEKLSFDEVYELSKEYPDLLEYCIEGLNNLEDDRLYFQKHNKNSKNKIEENRRFHFPDDYQVELSIFDENGLMELYLPMEILEGVSTSMDTATGGSVIIIPQKEEQTLINICESNGWKISQNNSLLNDAFMKGINVLSNQTYRDEVIEQMDEFDKDEEKQPPKSLESISYKKPEKIRETFKDKHHTPTDEERIYLMNRYKKGDRKSKPKYSENIGEVKSSKYDTFKFYVNDNKFGKYIRIDEVFTQGSDHKQVSFVQIPSEIIVDFIRLLKEGENIILKEEKGVR